MTETFHDYDGSFGAYDGPFVHRRIVGRRPIDAGRPFLVRPNSVVFELRKEDHAVDRVRDADRRAACEVMSEARSTARRAGCVAARHRRSRRRVRSATAGRHA